MSKQTDVFAVLNADHARFLTSYRPQQSEEWPVLSGKTPKDNCPLLDSLGDCEQLLRKIRKLCRKLEPPNQEAALITVVKFLRSSRDKRVFRQLKRTVQDLRAREPKSVLKLVSVQHAEIYDKALSRVLFRLSGNQFPPRIVYKLVWSCPVTCLPCPSRMPSDWHLFNVFRQVFGVQDECPAQDKEGKKQEKETRLFLD